MGRLAAALLVLLFWQVPAMSQNASPTVTAEEWAAYKGRFVAADGRVIDDGNGGISHSEGQGYGLLLAYLAGERADFELIWSFTRDSLLLRDDGLAVWKWDPAKSPPVTDANNASDGDLLIAYALALAGSEWEVPSFSRSAQRIAQALLNTSVYEYGGRVLLRPGVTGFDPPSQPDGPVVNPSYWVFEALPVMNDLVADGAWLRLGESGLQILRDGSFGDRGLPPDWLALSGAPAPAQEFPAEFSYNAMRIPLYLMRGPQTDMELLRRMRDGMTAADGDVVLVDLKSGAMAAELDDAGYRIIPALADCVLDNLPLPPDLRRFEPTLYYPSTLHLLALSHARKERPECL